VGLEERSADVQQKLEAPQRAKAKTLGRYELPEQEKIGVDSFET
jgi:hypothetical protein